MQQNICQLQELNWFYITHAMLQDAYRVCLHDSSRNKRGAQKSITEDDSILATSALIKRVSIVIKNDQSLHKKHRMSA